MSWGDGALFGGYVPINLCPEGVCVDVPAVVSKRT